MDRIGCFDALLGSLDLGETGYAYLVSRNVYVSHPDPQYVLQQLRTTDRPDRPEDPSSTAELPFAGALAARLAFGADLQAAMGYAQVAAALHVSRTPDERKSITPEMVLGMAGKA